MKNKMEARKTFLENDWGKALQGRMVYLCHEDELYMLLQR